MGLGSTAGRGAAGTGASERRALSPAVESCSGSPSGSVTWDRHCGEPPSKGPS